MKNNKTKILILTFILLMIFCVVGVIIIVNIKKETKNNEVNEVVESNSELALKNITDFTYSLINSNKITNNIASDSKLILTLKELEEGYGFDFKQTCNEDETKVEINFDEDGKADKINVNTMCN